MKKNQEGFSIVEFILVIIIIGLLCAVGWLTYKKAHTTTNSSTVSSKTIPASIKPSAASLTTIVSDIKNANFARAYTYIVPMPNSQQSSAGEVTYSVPGFSYLVIADDTATLELHGNATTATQSTVDSTLEAIASILKSNDFTYVNSPPLAVKDPPGVTGGFYDDTDTGYYVRNDDVCLLGGYYRAAAAPYTLFYAPIILDCTSTQALANVASAVKPFALVCDEVSDCNAATLGYGMPVITTLNSGYKYAEVGVPEGTLYFYTDSSGNNWQFALESEEGVPCNALTTTDAQTAFAGVCYTGSP